MNTQTVRNSVLALIGLASLVLYVLACASFSPDDSKVVYPSFDPKTGAIGVSVYDRQSGRTEQVFLPTFFKSTADTDQEPRLLRPQWLPDGKGILVAWPGASGSDDRGLNLALLPLGGRGATKLFVLPDIQSVAEKLVRPLALAGSRVFVVAESNRVVRLDLTTGELRSALGKKETRLYPSPRGDRVFYLAEDASTEGQMEFGRMDPTTFAQTPIMRFKPEETAGEGDFFTVSPDGRTAACLQGRGDELGLVVMRDGKPESKRPLASKNERLRLGNGQFSPRGDVVYASFRSQAEAATNVSFGLLEIPLSGSPVRRTTLLSGVGKRDDDTVLYFEIGLSNDGKTAAVASTYLAGDDEEFKADDCALFLIDLADPQRKVTKVRIPLPPKPKPDGKP